MRTHLRTELQVLALAVQFLTRIPVPTSNDFCSRQFAESVRYFPLVGLAIGGLAAATFWASALVFPPLVAVLLSTALSMLVTGAFHEDGLADTFDGIGGGTTPERVLEIMKDSRIGTYGMLALTMVVALKIASLTALPPTTLIVALIVAHSLSRWSALVVIASSKYVRDPGAGKPVAEGISARSMLIATVLALAAVALLFALLPAVMAAGGLSGMALGHMLIRHNFEERVGGYTGDCLGATQQLSELGIYLGILACQSL